MPVLSCAFSLGLAEKAVNKKNMSDAHTSLSGSSSQQPTSAEFQCHALQGPRAQYSRPCLSFCNEATQTGGVGECPLVLMHLLLLDTCRLGGIKGRKRVRGLWGGDLRWGACFELRPEASADCSPNPGVARPYWASLADLSLHDPRTLQLRP